MNERITKVGAYATAMADRYLSARQKLAIMEPFIGEDITKLFDKSYGAHAHDALALTLVLDLIRDICAFALDDDERAPSLVNIWRLMQAKDLHDALRNKAAQPLKANTHFGEGIKEEEKAGLVEKWRAQDIEERGKAFDEAYAQVAKGVPNIADSDLAGKFLLARNRAIAHYEMRAGENGPELYKLADAGLTWGSPRQFMDQLDPVLWDTVLVATWGSYDERAFDRAARLYAADFWARLQGKPPVSHVD